MCNFNDKPFSRKNSQITCYRQNQVPPIPHQPANKLLLMKLLLPILIFTALFQTVNSQIVRGIVMDRDSKDKISFATAYFNGTYLGTNTDSTGSFVLYTNDKIKMPLTVGALGYYTTTVNEYRSDTINLIYLVPKIYELNEVLVTTESDPQKRRENLRFFRKEFLGSSERAINCEIVNENDIILFYDNIKRRFIAFTSKPIIIINHYLGYKIIYYLDKFEFKYSADFRQITGSIMGNYMFLEYSDNDIEPQKKLEKRRETAYMGSRMQFFRELWNNNLEPAGFNIIDSLNSKLDYKKLVVTSETNSQSDREKYLNFDGKLIIKYKTRSTSAIIKTDKNKVHFTENGFFDPDGISWEGEMSRQRIGDLLPFEYKIDKKITHLQ